MKRLVLILSLFLLASGSYAQSFKGALLAGVNLSQVDGDRLSGYNKVGPVFGVAISRGLKENWSLEMDILGSFKGARPRADENNLGTLAFRRLNAIYVEVPFLLRYHYQKFKFLGGASFGVLVAAQREDNVGTFDVTDSYKRMEFTGIFGATYALNKQWELFSRFSYSLGCVSGVNCGSLFVNPKLRVGYFNNVLAFGLIRKFK
ncbi:MAG: PorT family protein [Bacteroidetes bacterium]|nr:MAG: PorT family protein [Bacteroidota bacterium]